MIPPHPSKLPLANKNIITGAGNFQTGPQPAAIA